MSGEHFYHFLLSRGRNIVGGCPVTQSDALVLANILSQPNVDLEGTIKGLESVLSNLKATKRYKPNMRILCSLKDRLTGLIVSPEKGISARSALMLCKLYRMNNGPALRILRHELEKLAMGLGKPGKKVFPCLIAEDFKMKVGD